jgi:tyrosine-specific transport protein
MKELEAIFTLSNTIIGVGFFSLPFLTLKVGFFPMLFYFIFLGSLVIIVHQIYAKISISLPDYKRLPSFAKIYLGSFAEKIAFLITILGSIGALLAYLILGGSFLAQILNGSENFWTIFYFIIGVFFIFFDIKLISKIESFSFLLFLFILFLIFFASFPKLNFNNIPFKKIDFSHLFLPYGPIIFSLWGASLIPEIEEMLREKKQKLKKVVFLSIFIPILVYIFFIFLVLSITGKETDPSALISLKNFLGEKLSFLAFFLGVIVTFTSFLTVGLTLKKILWYDLKLGKNLAFFLAFLPPILLYFLGIKEFIPVISFVGAVCLGGEGLIILAIFKKIEKRANYIYLLAIVFLVGIFSEIIKF